MEGGVTALSALFEIFRARVSIRAMIVRQKSGVSNGTIESDHDPRSA